MIPLYLYNIPRNNYYTWNILLLSIYFLYPEKPIQPTALTSPLPVLHLLPSFFLWSSPRPISSSQLHPLLHFHSCPIYLVLSKGSYFFRMGHLILRGASRLDAFSVYPVRTWLPCHGTGVPTDAPVVRPSRSSRTGDSSSQISFARAG